MATEGFISISMESVLEDVIKQHGTRLSDMDLASRRADEAASRRYEAAAWLRRTVGVVVAKDLPEEPSEEEFRIGLRNGIILCNAINKVQPGAIPKVVEAPVDSFVVLDGAPLSAYQYFENVRNFLVTLQDLGLPTFEASDLERGGKGSRVVDSVLALKFHVEGKQVGKNGSSKFVGIIRPASSVKHFIRKTSEPFMNSISRAQSMPEKQPDDLSMEHNLNGDFLIQSTEMKSSHSLNMLVRTVLSNKKPEEVPLLVESMLNKVMQEFERRIANQNELAKSTFEDMSFGNKSNSTEPSYFPTEAKMDLHGNISTITKMKESHIKDKAINELEESLMKQKMEEAEVATLKERVMLMEQKVKMEEKSFQERLLPQQTNSIEDEDPKGMEEVKEDLDKKTLMDRLTKQQTKEMKQKAVKERLIKQQLIFDCQQKEIRELKCAHHSTKTGMEYMKSHYLEEFRNLGNQLRSLANAASGYDKILKENRKLYNEIQDLKGNIRVYCRVRPFLPGKVSNTSNISRMDDQNIIIAAQTKIGKDAHRNFKFNKVFGSSATQEEVFSDTQPLIRSVLDGYNVCIFAYGQTGSGKTHTMTGPKELNEKTIGVNYRALNDLFYLLEQRKDIISYEISVQMLEIYNEQVRDLLSDGLNKRLEIRNSSNTGLSVPDANVIPVRSSAEVIEIMNLGHKNRAVGSTAMNDRSSRSHSCLTIHVQGIELTSGNTLRGCMHLVDLAGSERVDKSEVKGDRLKEAQHINKSLSALGDVIASLAQKNAHVPYRNSKLTQLLQDSLGGHAKTLMFVHISPEADALGETLSTLKFAERVATVELGAAKINKDNSEVKELKEQIAALKSELARKGAGEPLRTAMSSPDLSRMKPNATSSIYSNYEDDELGCPTSNRQPMEEVGNIEVRSNSTRKKKPTYHSEELQVSADSPWFYCCPRPDDDDKETGTGEWVDKVVVNNKCEAPVRERDVAQDQEFLQEYVNEMTVYPVQQLSKIASGKKGSPDLQKDQSDSDSDDLENSTSESSEVELLSQLNVSKIPSVANGGMSKLKRPQAKSIKGIDGRNLSHGHIPSPSRKVSNGPTQTPMRTVRQPTSGDGKRPGMKSSGK